VIRALTAAAAVTALLAYAAGPPRHAGMLPLPPSATIDAVSSVVEAPNGHLFVLQRGAPPLLEFDAERNFVRGMGDGLFKTAHGLRIDGRGNLWTTDNGNHVIRKFTLGGELLATYGEVNVAGAGRTHFHSPDDLVFSATGEMYVADSGNWRVVHLDANGQYLNEWGGKGAEPGQFKIPHSLAIDGRGRVYVADRGNDRIQIFSPEGKLIEIWKGFGNPFGLLLAGAAMYVSTADVDEIVKLDQTGAVIERLGGPGKLQQPHFLAMTRKGALLVAEVGGKRVQIFSREKE
jgi:DNA-binding beta-propeller fold protein YncE